MDTPHKAFVIMPFDPEFQAIYNDLILPSLKDAGFAVSRADSFINQQNILKDIVREIATSDLIVADLTTLNSNVLYELGIAHGLNKPTVLLVQSIDEIPFDLRSYRILVYSTHFAEVKTIITALSQLAAKFKVGTVQFGNPVSDFLPAVAPLPNLATATTAGAPAGPSALPHDMEADAKGWLDWLVDAESALLKSQTITEEMNTALKDFAEQISQRANQLTEAKRLNTPGTASQMLNIAKAAASETTTLADKLETKLEPFRQCWETIYEGTTAMLASAKLQDEKDKAALLTFREQWAQMTQAMKSALDGVCGFRKIVAALPPASRDMNKSAKRLTSVLDAQIAEIEHSHAFATKVLALMDEKLQ